MERLLAIDPAWKKTGWVVVEHESGQIRLVDFGDFIPPAKTLPATKSRPAQTLSMAERVDGLIEKMGAVTDRHGPRNGVRRAAIEVPDGHVYATNKSGAGLSVYGLAAGVLLMVLRDIYGDGATECVGSSEWTGKFGGGKSRSKAARRGAVRLIVSGSDRIPPSDLDTWDALGVAVYAIDAIQVRAVLDQASG